jgi:hypothetical protein
MRDAVAALSAMRMPVRCARAVGIDANRAVRLIDLRWREFRCHKLGRAARYECEEHRCCKR